MEKIPHLVELGVTAVELLPIFQFDAQDAPAGRVNYWGYSPIAFAGGGLAYDLSAEVKPFLDVPLTLAVDYKHKSHVKLEGDARFFNVPAPLRPSLPGQGVTHHFVVPNSLNVGVAGRPVPELLLAFTWTMDRYSVYREDRFTGDQGLEVVVPRNYGNG